ncbi:hypothetical protein, partial [Campylobacter canadensis]
ILLYKKDALWVDLDMVCLKYFNYDEKGYIFSKEIDDNPNISRVTTSLLKVPKQSAFAKLLIDEAKKIIADKKIIPWGIIGPNFLAQLVKENKLEDYAIDYKESCQIPWYKAADFVKNNISFDENRLCLHLFSEMWRTNNINKNCFYKHGIYADLLKKHNIKEFLKKLDYKISFYDKNYIFISLLINIKNKIRFYFRHPKKIFRINNE